MVDSSVGVADTEREISEIEVDGADEGAAVGVGVGVVVDIWGSEKDGLGRSMALHSAFAACRTAVWC